MKLINDIINLINAPYFITDDPYIEVFNPRITILEDGEYQYKIITERKIITKHWIRLKTNYRP